MIVTIAKLYACWWWLTGGQACWLLLQSYSLDNWPPFAESPISTPWAQSGTFSAITWMHTNTESSNIEQKFPTHLFCHCHWSTQRAEESLVKYHCVDTGDRRVSVIKATSNWKAKWWKLLDLSPPSCWSWQQCSGSSGGPKKSRQKKVLLLGLQGEI